MSFVTLVIVAAAFAAVAAFASGISSMATVREVGHFASARWMEVSINIIGNARQLFPSQ